MSAATVVRADDLTEAGEGIYYSRHEIPLVDETVIDVLKHAARTNSKRRARFCAHPSAEARQHDMLIVSHRDTYVAPHRHFDKSESFLILEGSATIILFDDRGGPRKPSRWDLPGQQGHSSTACRPASFIRSRSTASFWCSSRARWVHFAPMKARTGLGPRRPKMPSTAEPTSRQYCTKAPGTNHHRIRRRGGTILQWGETEARAHSTCCF